MTEGGESFQVSGLVVDFEGNPLHGEEVHALDVYTWEEVSSGTTLDDGSFVLEVDRTVSVAPVKHPWENATPGVTEWFHLSNRTRAKGPRDDLLFVVGERCGMWIDVVDEQGRPVSDAAVWATVDDPQWGSRQDSGNTDDGGGVELSLLCGEGEVVVTAEGFATARRAIDSARQDHLVVELGEGVLVRGRVVDDAGEAVAAGEVGLHHSLVPFSDGLFELRFEPGTWRLRVLGEDQGVIGYSSWRDEIELSGSGLELEIELERFHRVNVWCAGLQDDRCRSVVPIRCDAGLLPSDRVCHLAEDGTECKCPLEGATVRAAEARVEVLPEDTDVWLDFRDKGTILGTVVNCPLGECFIAAARLAIGQTGTPPLHTTLLGPDGSFELKGLSEGTWGLVIGKTAWVLDLPDVELDAGEVVDLGIIDVGAEGGVSGVVVDGLTGEGRPWEAVAVRSTEHRSGVNPLGSVGVAGPDGAFTVRGLPRGDYDVFLLRRPLERTTVSVLGSVVDGLILETAEASVLDEQGFGVDEELVVNALDPDGWAAEAGLEEGDAIVGVTMMGLDTTLLDPRYSVQAAQGVLQHYSGPGVGLVVERDGDLYDIDLE